MKKLLTYENKLLLLMFLTFGLVFMDKLSFNFLLPFIAEDLNLNNTQNGLVLGVLSAFFGISTLVFSNISDVIGSKKKMLVIFVLLFSFATLTVGLISDFNSLLIIRAMMGITEGPVVPLILAIVLAESTINRRGFNMGIVKGSGPLMSSVFAPIILIPIAIAYSWKWGFYTLAIPGFILGLVIWWFVKEPVFDQKNDKPSWSELRKVYSNKNIILCLLISVFFMINLSTFVGFVPLFWANTKQLEQNDISVLLAVFGSGSFIWFFAIPAISDRIGRKPTLVFFSLTSILLPLVISTADMSFGLTIGALLLLTSSLGYMPLFDAIIPSESVPHRYAASVMAATVLTGEAIGGTFGPMIGGYLSDLHGGDLRWPMYVGAAAAFITFLISLGIKETRTKNNDEKVYQHH